MARDEDRHSGAPAPAMARNSLFVDPVTSSHRAGTSMPAPATASAT